MLASNLGKRMGLLLLPLLAIGMVTSLTLAAKPGGGDGSVPTGRIYYNWSSAIYADGSDTIEFRGYWSMNADGSNKLPAAYQPPRDRHHLSYQVHQGHRWYLEIARSTTYPTRSALFAVRDDGDPDCDVLLLETAELPGDPSPSICRWSQDDTFISFVVRVAGPTALAEIWVAEIVFDELSGRPAIMTPAFPVVQGEQPGWTDIRAYDWSPDGTQVAYGLEPNGDIGTIKIKDLVTAETRILADDSYYPNWSPDGQRIAFKPFNEGVHVINPDGSSLLRLTNGWDWPAGWSADSKHVIFTRAGYYRGSGSIYFADVLRVPAAGGSVINLTKDIDGYADSHGWR